MRAPARWVYILRYPSDRERPAFWSGRKNIGGQRPVLIEVGQPFLLKEIVFPNCPLGGRLPVLLDQERLYGSEVGNEIVGLVVCGIG